MLFESALHAIDPYLEFLESLEWDGVERIDSFLETVFHVADTDPALTVWASRAIVMAPIKRAVEPGAQVDEVPILCGPQGCGKSSLVRALVPDATYLGDFSLAEISTSGVGNRDLLDRLTRFPLVELSEMDGINEKSMAPRRAFLTRRDDAFAAKWQSTRLVPRRFCFVGTANEGHAVPSDDTGSRRFAPLAVELHPLSLDTDEPGAYASITTAAMRGQLLAEGLRRIRAGESIHLPHALKGAQQAAFDQHVARDPYDDAIALIERECALSCPPPGFSIYEVIELAKLTTRKVVSQAGEEEVVDPGQRLPHGTIIRIGRVLGARKWSKEHKDFGNRCSLPA